MNNNIEYQYFLLYSEKCLNRTSSGLKLLFGFGWCSVSSGSQCTWLGKTVLHTCFVYTGFGLIRFHCITTSYFKHNATKRVRAITCYHMNLRQIKLKICDVISQMLALLDNWGVDTWLLVNLIPRKLVLYRNILVTWKFDHSTIPLNLE